MLKIRLSRFGRKKKPTYRIVVANATSPRDGKFLEILGNYDPMINLESANYNEMVDGNQKKKQKFVMNVERLSYWLGVGAQPTDRIKLFISKLDDSNISVFIEKFKKELFERQEAAKANPPKEKKKKK